MCSNGNSLFIHFLKLDQRLRCNRSGVVIGSGIGLLSLAAVVLSEMPFWQVCSASPCEESHRAAALVNKWLVCHLFSS